MGDTPTLEQTLLDRPSGLQEKIGRSVGNFTTALFGVFEKTRQLRLAGTGTFVLANDVPYVLTAAHVWHEVLQEANAVGVTLREGVDHRDLIRRDSIIPAGPQRPAAWGEWGPDLIFLRIPREYMGQIQAYRTFYNLANLLGPDLALPHLHLRMLIGAPAALGEFTSTHASFEINGFYSDVNARAYKRGDFDYLDLDTDLSLPGVVRDFGGVSGGGVWRILLYRSPSTGEIDWIASLEGVAFYRLAVENSHRVIRCHGPETIRAAVPREV